MNEEMIKALKAVVDLYEADQIEKGLVPFQGEGQQMAKDMEAPAPEAAPEEEAEADAQADMDKGPGYGYDADVMGMQSAILSGIIAGASEYGKAGNSMSYKGDKTDMMSVNGHLRAMSKAYGDMAGEE